MVDAQSGPSVSEIVDRVRNRSGRSRSGDPGGGEVMPGEEIGGASVGMTGERGPEGGVGEVMCSLVGGGEDPSTLRFFCSPSADTLLPALFLLDESRRVMADSRLREENREVDRGFEEELAEEGGRKGGRAGLGEVDDDDDGGEVDGRLGCDCDEPIVDVYIIRILSNCLIKAIDIVDKRGS